jgi:hypothetical protein
MGLALLFEVTCRSPARLKNLSLGRHPGGLQSRRIWRAAVRLPGKVISAARQILHGLKAVQNDASKKKGSKHYPVFAEN